MIVVNTNTVTVNTNTVTMVHNRNTNTVTVTNNNDRVITITGINRQQYTQLRKGNTVMINNTNTVNVVNTGTVRIVKTYDVITPVVNTTPRQRVARVYNVVNVINTTPVVLVQCVGNQNRVVKQCTAGSLFLSRWFNKAITWSRSHGYDVRIISAQHGLVKTDDVITPYNLTVAWLPERGKIAWANDIVDSIVQTIPNTTPIIVLAGVSYRENVVPQLIERGYTVRIPMANMGIGQQEQYLKATLGTHTV